MTLVVPVHRNRGILTSLFLAPLALPFSFAQFEQNMNLFLPDFEFPCFVLFSFRFNNNI
jgi:hypothetical protein